MGIVKGLILSGRNRSHPEPSHIFDFEQFGDLAEDGPCRQVIESICHQQRTGEECTVWKIHQATGLQLHEAFAALRTLEYGKIIEIRDNPSDPFGATISLLTGGIEASTRRNVA